MKSAWFLFTLLFSTLAALGLESERVDTGSEIAAIAHADLYDLPSFGLSSRDSELPVVFLRAPGPSLDVLPRQQGILSRVVARKLGSSSPLTIKVSSLPITDTRLAYTDRKWEI